MSLRKIFTVLLSIVMLMSVSMTAFAAETEDSFSTADVATLSIDKDLVVSKIRENHGFVVTPTDAYYLFDTSGNPTYSCVEFSCPNGNDGYAIIDLSTYDLTLYSIEMRPPFNHNNKVIYSGLLDFAIVQNDNAHVFDVNSERTIDINAVKSSTRDNVVVLDPKTREAIVSENFALDVSERAAAADVAVTGAYDETLVYSAGNNSGSYTTDCGINAVAMYLRHLDKHFDDGYLPSNLTTEEKIKVSLAAYADTELGQLTSLTLSQLATLSNGHTKKYGTKATSISSSSYSWTTYKNVINSGNGVPCILRIGAGETNYWDKAHFVIGVGYTSGATASSGSIRVNSGWSRLKYVYIGTSIPSHIGK